MFDNRGALCACAGRRAARDSLLLPAPPSRRLPSASRSCAASAPAPPPPASALLPLPRRPPPSSLPPPPPGLGAAVACTGLSFPQPTCGAGPERAGGRLTKSPRPMVWNLPRQGFCCSFPVYVARPSFQRPLSRVGGLYRPELGLQGEAPRAAAAPRPCRDTSAVHPTFYPSCTCVPSCF
ncbi:uncharacterized protein LOC110218922 [Phascolarctos cinereus]